MSAIPLLKPAFGQQCNGCGVCCLAETCSLGLDIHGETDGPCPSLAWRDGRFWCALAEASDLVRFMLGVGFGCDSDDSLAGSGSDEGSR